MLFRVQGKVHIFCQHDVVIDFGTDEFALVVILAASVLIPQCQLIRFLFLLRESADFFFITPLC